LISLNKNTYDLCSLLLSLLILLLFYVIRSPNIRPPEVRALLRYSWHFYDNRSVAVYGVFLGRGDYADRSTSLFVIYLFIAKFVCVYVSMVSKISSGWQIAADERSLTSVLPAYAYVLEFVWLISALCLLSQSVIWTTFRQGSFPAESRVLLT
jgi:hypothetical protein